MDFMIYCDGKLIAQFLRESDRDLCFDALQEEYPDCRWTTTKSAVSAVAERRKL